MTIRILPAALIALALSFSLPLAAKGLTMRQTIEKYAKGADTRNTAYLDKAFHDHFQVIALTPDGVMKLDKKGYIGLIKAKKIGGVKRQLKILSMSDDGKVGTAKLTLSGGKLVFHDFLTLIKTNVGWQIVGNAAHISTVK